MEPYIAFLCGLAAGIALACVAGAWALLRVVDANTSALDMCLASGELQRAHTKHISSEIRGYLVTDMLPNVPFVLPGSHN